MYSEFLKAFFNKRITSVLSKVFEHLVSVRLGQFMERSGVIRTTQFAFRKGKGTCDALLCVSHTLQSVLKSGQEARIMQIDFSAAYDRVCDGRLLATRQRFTLFL